MRTRVKINKPRKRPNRERTDHFAAGVLKLRLHDTAGCQTGCTTGLTTGLTIGLTTVLNEQLFVQPVVKPGCTTALTTGCIHDTAGCQTGCQTGLTTGWMFVTRYNRLSNRFDNRFDNRLYRVNGALHVFTVFKSSVLFLHSAGTGFPSSTPSLSAEKEHFPSTTFNFDPLILT